MEEQLLSEKFVLIGHNILPDFIFDVNDAFIRNLKTPKSMVTHLDW
jgi:hypothetical protein